MIFEGWDYFRLARVFFRLFGFFKDFIYNLKQDFTKSFFRLSSAGRIFSCIAFDDSGVAALRIH